VVGTINCGGTYEHPPAYGTLQVPDSFYGVTPGRPWLPILAWASRLNLVLLVPTAGVDRGAS